MPDSAVINGERPLGPTEDMYWRFDAVSPLNFGTLSHFQGALDIEQLRLALDAVQARHPLLQMRISSDSKGQPWFRRSEAPVRLNYIRAARDGVWHMLEEQLSTPFHTEYGPLLRCTLIRHGSDSDSDSASLLMVFHHAISDGRSATFIMRDILQSLAQQARGEPAGLPILPLLGYYGERIPGIKDYKNLDELGSTAWKTLQTSAQFLANLGLPMGIRLGKETPPLQEQRLLIEPRFLDRETTLRIVQKAKAEEVTVQCVLNAALALAVVADSPTTQLQATSCTQVLDIRDRLIPPVGEDCGCFASGATSLHHLSAQSEFWPLARVIKKNLNDTLATPLPFFHPAMHKAYNALARTLGDAGKQTFSNILNKLHPEGLAVSNLGLVKFDIADSPVSIDAFAFATNTTVLNYLNTSVTTFNGEMSWSFSASTVVGRPRLAAIADSTVARMLKALQE